MKLNTLPFVFLLLLSAVFCNTLSANAQGHSHSHDESNTPKSFVNMRFKTALTNEFDNVVALENIGKDSFALIMYYRTDCGHCRLDGAKLSNLVPKYNSKFWLITPDNDKDTEEYITTFKLKNVNNLTLLQDFLKGMHDWFNFRYVPFIALVDGKGGFVKEFNTLPSPEEVDDVIATYQTIQSMK